MNIIKIALVEPERVECDRFRNPHGSTSLSLQRYLDNSGQSFSSDQVAQIESILIDTHDCVSFPIYNGTTSTGQPCNLYKERIILETLCEYTNPRSNIK